MASFGQADRPLRFRTANLSDDDSSGRARSVALNDFLTGPGSALQRPQFGFSAWRRRSSGMRLVAAQEGQGNQPARGHVDGDEIPPESCALALLGPRTGGL